VAPYSPSFNVRQLNKTQTVTHALLTDLFRGFKLYDMIRFESILTAVSPVYNVDYLLKQRDSSHFHVLVYSQSDSVEV